MMMKDKFRQIGVTAVFFFVVMGVGSYFVKSSWDGVVFVSLSGRADRARGPAGIPKKIDFYHLSGSAFNKQARERIVEELRVVSNKDGVGIEFGNFAFRAKDGSRQLACDSLDRVTVTLVAEGMAVSGERPTIVVEGPCDYRNSDLNKVAPVWIPVSKILKANPWGAETTIEEGETKLTFSSIGDSWPMQWEIASVRLHDQNDASTDVTVTQRDFVEQMSDLVKVNWNVYMDRRLATDEEKTGH